MLSRWLKGLATAVQRRPPFFFLLPPFLPPPCWGLGPACSRANSQFKLV